MTWIERKDDENVDYAGGEIRTHSTQSVGIEKWASDDSIPMKEKANQPQMF